MSTFHQYICTKTKKTKIPLTLSSDTLLNMRRASIAKGGHRPNIGNQSQRPSMGPSQKRKRSRTRSRTRSVQLQLQANNDQASDQVSELPPKRYGPRPELTNKQTLELYKAFGTFDPRGSGLIETRGFILSLRAMTYEPKFDEVDELIAKVLGPEEKKVFDFKDYYRLMTAKMIGKDSKEDVQKAFRMFCGPDNDCITLDNLVAIAEELGEDISKEELQDLISFADSNKNGVVTFDEFANILKRPVLE